jgi:hypothetical protein
VLRYGYELYIGNVILADCNGNGSCKSQNVMEMVFPTIGGWLETETKPI